jgi:putative glycerol-1-phosphate prenyltransferase
MAVFDSLMEVRNKKGGAFFLLLDPDRTPENRMLSFAEAAEENEVDALLVGSSMMLRSNFHEAVKGIKKSSALPVIIFPGSHSQISPDADAILFMSLISGRNPDYLITEQVRGAPLVREYGLETIATGYMLIESGGYSSIQYISNTMPIPSQKYDIACAHALAAEYMGMKTVFMEAGSGARQSVPEEMIRAVSEYVKLPIIVGGGIREPGEVESKIRAGASFAVVGNQFERDLNIESLREFAAAAHPLSQVTI